MVRFSREKVLLLHQLIAQETGGEVGLRDQALLDAALAAAFAGMADREFYPTKPEKAAKLGFDLISNHAFLDGNKRIGMYVMLTFLEANGVALEATDEDVTEAGLGVASGAWTYEKLLAWVKEHLA